MELRELSEMILFGTTLEDKLWSPSTITDTRPGPPAGVPQAPGRPPGLALEQTAGSDFPKSRELEQESGRGRALGFFANHELLALELLALALVRFPDAPPSFRQDLLATIRDEQRHLRLYLSRMQEIGAELGEHALSGFFWRILSGIDGPEQLAAGLSLCLEQANLDHAVRYRTLFEQAGDLDTAAVLHQVLVDEIRHVQRGLAWVRRWKEHGESDWGAWMRMLPHPLTPARARGASILRAPRLAAGLDLDFIVRLETWGQDKGRPPRLWYFNPEMEEEIEGRSPSKASRSLRRDHDAILLFMSSPTDVVLVDRLPRPSWLEHLRRSGVRLPRFHQAAAFATQRCQSLHPWGWTPSQMQRALQLQTIETPPCTEAQLLTATSKLHAMVRAQSWLDMARPHLDPDDDWLAPSGHLGFAVHSAAALHQGLLDLSAQGWRRAVLKAPLGTAGRAQRIVSLQEAVAAPPWGVDVIEKQGGLRVEPWLDRVFDFSTQLELEASGRARVIGHVECINSPRGQFEGAVVGRFGHHAPGPIRRLLFENARIACLGQSLATQAPALMGPGRRLGPLGIDHFVYRCPEGGLRLRPLLEVNPRLTMGRISMQLRKLIEPGQTGIWRWLPCKALTKPPALMAPDLIGSETSRGTTGRIQDGLICTNDPGRAQLHLSLLSVGQDATCCEARFQPLLNGGRSGLLNPT